MITASEIATSAPPRDIEAYRAGQAHARLRGGLGPRVKDMEEAWVRYGWVKLPSEKRMASMHFANCWDFTTATANLLYSDRWDFASWQQGVYELQFNVTR